VSALPFDHIRRLSKKVKQVVSKCVQEDFLSDTGNSFVLGIPASVLDWIVAGVAHFSEPSSH
jgi:hypothetical protein